tara:strand:- start:173 stop:340 length:168 start_codon:yes stop_codon:yes gene_type:complete
MALSLFCLGNCIIVYCLYEYYKWSSKNVSKAASPALKLEDESGKSNLLSEASIRG